MRPRSGFVAAAAAVLLTAPVARGQEAGAPEGARLDALTAEVADRLRCPVCRNQSVLESSSELARQMQAVIRDRLAAGESPVEVEAYFVARYGEWILLKPEPRGLNLAVYLLPAAIVLAGGLLVRSRLRAWRAAGGGGSEVDGTPPVSGGLPVDAGRRPEAGAGPDEAEFSERDREWLNEAIRRV